MSIQLLITQIYEVAIIFPTHQWKGHCGCLVLILNESKMRLLTVNNDLARRPIPKRDAVNPLIANDTKGRDLIILQEDQKTLYKEYDLQEAVDACGVTTIEQVVDVQYIKEKRKE